MRRLFRCHSTQGRSPSSFNVTAVTGLGSTPVAIAPPIPTGVRLPGPIATAVKNGTNALILGSHGVGKSTALRIIHRQLKESGRAVAMTSANPRRIHRIEGLAIQLILGLRLITEESLVYEQVVGNLARHARVSTTKYESLFPSLSTVDVLLIDSAHLLPAVVWRALDTVARQVREKPNEPFGGLHVVATADLWQMDVSPGSDYAGYFFQLPNFSELFPTQHILTKIHHQAECPELQGLTHRALWGEMRAEDAERLQRLAVGGNSHASPLVAHEEGYFKLHPRFSRTPARRQTPPRAAILRRSEFGQYFVMSLSMLSQAAHFGFPERMTLEPGTTVSLLYPRLGIDAGEMGVVESVLPNRINVHFPRLNVTEAIEMVHIRVSVPGYEDVEYGVAQYPLLYRNVVSTSTVLSYNHVRHVTADAMLLTETNDLGNFLSRMRNFTDFTLTNVFDQVRQDGLVHEPTRVYLNTLLDAGHYSGDVKISPRNEEWCRNCKAPFSRKSFASHWNACVQEVRWCVHCSCTVPSDRIEAHSEKHQVVLCIDCGTAVEWRNWEGHRLACIPMMREITPDNSLLPSTTRQAALQLGFDHRDLHTVKNISKSNLPKKRSNVTKGVGRNVAKVTPVK